MRIRNTQARTAKSLSADHAAESGTVNVRKKKNEVGLSNQGAAPYLTGFRLFMKFHYRYRGVLSPLTYFPSFLPSRRMSLWRVRLLPW